MNLEEIYTAYFGDVYRYLLKLSGHQQTAEDLTAETFLKAMDSLSTFRGQCPLRLWLCRIARNLWYDSLRRQKKQPVLPPEEGVQEGFEDALMLHEEAEAALDRVDALPSPAREVFRLRLGGMAFHSIGSMYGKTANWACVVYHRARMRLQKEMEEYYGSDTL